MSHAATHCLAYSVDLNRPIAKQYLNDLFVTDDHEAHQIDVQLFRGNSPVQLPSNAAVIGYFIRYSDNNTVTLSGKVNGNTASVLLNETCYALPGQFAVVVKVTEGTPVSAVFHAEGSMLASKTDKVIDGGNTIPSLDELLAKIADIEDATSDGRAAAQEARDAGTQAVAIAQDAAGEALAAAQTVQSIYEVKADAIMDESARAASHVIYPQDGPLAVTLYGQTTEMGTGDKSPDNPYVISGVDAAQVHAGGANLIPPEEIKAPFSTNTNIHVSKNKGILLGAGSYSFSYKGTVTPLQISATEIDGEHLVVKYNTKTISFALAKPTVVYFDVYATPLDNVGTDAVMLNAGDTALPYEPYTANVITPALLPDGSPLHGNGTVDDTIENDVLSGCDKKIVRVDAPYNSTINACIYGSSALTDAIPIASNSQIGTIFCNAAPTNSASNINGGQCGIGYTTAGVIYLKIDGLNSKAEYEEYFAANPLTVFYRSTAYTPKNDLKVCKAVRKWKTVTLDGEELWGFGDGLVYTNTGKNLVAGYPACDRIPPQSPYMYDIGVYALANGTVNFKHPVYTANLDAWKAYLKEQNAAGAPMIVSVQLATPETYMTDPLYLRKPTGITPVTVTGSAETAVTYPHDTKHYIDSKISELVTLALANQ